jgi:phosphoribosylamine--glycine ligase
MVKSVQRRILIVGGGGREHALALGLAAAPSVTAVHVTPGNAGTAECAQNHSVTAADIDGLVDLAQHLDIDLVVVGPEGPLVEGLAERLRAAGISCFGPHVEGAMLEGSKLVAKRVMQEVGVPTAGFQVIESITAIGPALDEFEAPWVVKRDVLAGGKGVLVTAERVQAEEFLAQSVEQDGFVILEQFLEGEEASMLVVLDESGFVCLPASQDHKRVGDADAGPNTGGMGAYAPAPVVTAEVHQKVVERVIAPMHQYLSREPIPYRGCLYAGLMIDADGNPAVVEFNVRFGDPECQVTIPLIKSDLGQLLGAAAEGRLSEVQVQFSQKHALTVVLAAAGYPGRVQTGLPISGAQGKDESESGIAFVHHAGTGLDAAGDLIQTGGRVLSVTAVADSLHAARDLAYQRLKRIELEGSHHRTDIGFRALD